MRIGINTTQVAEAAHQFSTASDRLAQLGGELQAAIGSLDTWAWDGHSRTRAEPLLNRVRSDGEELAHGLHDLARKLARVAAVFEQEDATAAGNLAAMSWVDFDAGGAVLGVATAAIPTILLASLPLSGTAVLDVAHMSWAERFAAADALPGEIQQFEQARQEKQAELDRLNQDIDALDQQIANLQAQRDALQQQADQFLNKLIPDGLHWGFDDRFPDAPWRTRSDALEDRIADLDRRIAELQSQRAPLDQQRQNCQQELSNLDHQLNDLRQSQAELDHVMQSGIPMDGPSPKYPYFPAGNCTKYAASRRNVPCSGHAYQWNEQAQAAGFEIGDRPVPGAVMVMERGVTGVNATYGHVAIVERVERQPDGSYKVWYTDNRNPDPQNPSSRIIVPGAEEISFIYDKQ